MFLQVNTHADHAVLHCVGLIAAMDMVAQVQGMFIFWWHCVRQIAGGGGGALQMTAMHGMIITSNTCNKADPSGRTV
jgi:hypothetical protein